jgi:PAS domain S-box-containing protein
MMSNAGPVEPKTPEARRTEDGQPVPAKRRRISPLVAASMVLLAVAFVLGLSSLSMLRRSTFAIERNHLVEIRLERLLSNLKDLETGLRGYLLTGQESFLEPYNVASGQIESRLSALDELGADLAPLRAAALERRDAAAASLEAYRQLGKEAFLAAPAVGKGKAAMDRVRRLVADTQHATEEHDAALQRRIARVEWPMAIASVMLLLVSFALIALLAAQRRRTERASAMLLQGVMQNAPVGLGLLDRNLVVRHMNQALSTMSDRALNAAVGVGLWDVLPDLREPLERRLQLVLEGGRPVPNIEVQVGSKLRPDQMRDYQVTFFPVGSLEDRRGIEGAGMVVSDVTARKRIERRLRDSEERFRTLTEASASIIWSADPTGAFDKPQMQWSRFTGQDPDATLGSGWVEAVHPEDREHTLSAWAEAIAARSRYTVEQRLHHADGAWRYMSVTAMPMLDEQGEIREWVGMHEDITERKLAEMNLSAAKEAAEAANRAKSAFLANMSHELRTPLSAVIGYTEMMEEEAEEMGEQSLLVDLGKIKSNAKHLLSLINDVLDLSKIEANRMDTYAEDIDVQALVGEVAATVDSLVAQKNNRLELDLPEGLGGMHTDVVKLRQCLINLLSNASKFTENGTIRLSAERQGSGAEATVTFSVSDTGIGMTPEQVERLFQRFTQADETTTRKFGGTGLGLALTRAFSRMLGGDVAVDSSQGEGTTFRITLPAIMPAREPPPSETEPEGAKGEHDLSRDVVLVIDDDSSQRDLIIRFLDRQGFAARTAPDGASGLAMARAIMPRAILLDVMMPQMDGWSVLNALKADAELAKIPVIMVTFMNEKGLSNALGAADHINKPVDWNKLKQVMERLVEAKGDILVVDDDPDLRSRLRTVLERGGWSVQEAANGREALLKVAHGPPRAILLDLTMPVMDGFTFLHALRARPGCADIPVVVFSASDMSADERARLKDADKVLSKTVSLRELTGELRELAPPDTDRAGR